MLKRIFNWFVKGQAPPPEVLDEERGVDWDAWREVYDGVEWKKTRPMSLKGLNWEEIRRTSACFDHVPSNRYYGMFDD